VQHSPDAVEVARRIRVAGGEADRRAEQTPEDRRPARLPAGVVDAQQGGDLLTRERLRAGGQRALIGRVRARNAHADPTAALDGRRQAVHVDHHVLVGPDAERVGQGDPHRLAAERRDLAGARLPLSRHGHREVEGHREERRRPIGSARADQRQERLIGAGHFHREELGGARRACGPVIP
jgi:hypothetical protein